jgi:restriction endonuclease S subunit/predicted RNA methylase
MSQQAKMQKLTSCVKMVRDILRREGICDMDSMAHCVLFVGARMLNDSVGNLLNINKRWCVLLEHVKSKRIDEANQYFRDIMETFDTIFDTRDFGYKLEGRDNFKDIIMAFDDVDVHDITKETDVLGYIYEQHLSTGSGSGRDLGKYYTDRSITRYLTHLCAPKIINNRPESVCDVTMGTGGFLLSYINYITDIAKKNNKTVNWRDYDILGGDIDPRVAAIAKMNVFLKTGKLFPYVSRRNTLYLDITEDKAKADIVLMNVPFGVKGLIHKNCCQRVKDVIKEGTKSEPLFSFLGCEIVNLGGRGAIIVPDGVLDNTAKIYVNFRKYMLEKFDLKRIIKMKGKFFMNTTIQPSVLFFEYSGKPTTSVEFWDANKGNNGEIEDTLVLSVPKEKFVDDFSFSLRKYLPTVAIVNNMNYPMKKLGDIAKVSFGERITQKDNTGTIYPVYGSGFDTFKTDKFNRDGKTCKLGRFAISETNMAMIVNGPYWLMDSGFTVESKDEGVMLKEFLWNLLLTDKNHLSQCSTGSCQKNIEMDRFYTLEYPCPPLPIQQEIVTALDLIFADPQDMKDCLAFTDKAMDLMLKDATGKQLEDVLGGLREKRDCLNLCIRKKSQMAAVMRSVDARGFERKKLGDCLDVFKTGKNQNDLIEGNYPFYMSNGISQYANTYQFDGEYVLTARCGSLNGSQYYINGKFSASDFTYVLKPKEDLNACFLYNILRWIDWTPYQTGTTMKGIRRECLTNYEIPLPPLPIQHEVLAILNEMEAELATLEQMAVKAEQRAKFILDGYLTPAITVEAEPVTDPNSIAAFIEKHIVHEDGAETLFKKVASKYKEWATARNLQVLTVTELKAALSLVLGDLENDKYKGVKLI